MTTLAHRDVPLVACSNALTQSVRGLSLAAAGNVIQFTFNGKQRGGADVLRAQRLAPHAPIAAGQPKFLKHDLDSVQIELRRHVEHRVVRFTPPSVCLGTRNVAPNEIEVIVPVRAGKTIRRRQTAYCRKLGYTLRPTPRCYLVIGAGLVVLGALYLPLST